MSTRVSIGPRTGATHGVAGTPWMILDIRSCPLRRIDLTGVGAS